MDRAWDSGKLVFIKPAEIDVKISNEKKNSNLESDLCMTFSVKMIIFSYYFNSKSQSSNRDKTFLTL